MTHNVMMALAILTAACTERIEYYAVDGGSPVARADASNTGPTVGPAAAPCKLESWWLNGQKRSEGDCVCRFTNGLCAEGYPHGKLTSWHRNGQKASETTYAEGILDGPNYYWWDNGTMQAESAYAEGSPFGKTKAWSKDGALTACTCHGPLYSTIWSTTVPSECESKPCP